MGWVAVTLFAACSSWAAWAPAKGPLMTRWARDVSPETVHREYPRPQFTRDVWANLNGLWQYAIVAKDAPKPTAWEGEILVPFPIESALSGVMKRVGPDQRLWYRRTFRVPETWRAGRVLLHFGASDWETTVWVNGKEFAPHRGGYDSFTHDVTAALKADGEQELVVAVWDPTDAGYQPRGKQVRKPEGIWYTPTTGIWQTVWLEPVPETWVDGLRLYPDIDAGVLEIEAFVRGSGAARLWVEAYAGDRRISEASMDVEAGDGVRGRRIKLSVPEARLWSPEDPYLYDLKLTLLRDGDVVDTARSYFGMRKIALQKDDKGVNRLFLNNRPVFQYGPLDQGFWPDGLYTAPTDEALRYDIEITKRLGFNMARKHVKVEPARWYYWCDKLGLLVWQDMPSGEKHIGTRDPDITRSPESGAQFELELKRMITGLFNHPSIVMWVPYNEGWGQWDTARIVALVREWDATRLVNNASGWTDRGVGDVNDIHVYPGPGAPPLEPNRAGVLGEFGGLGLPVSGHTWQDEKNWGYRSYTNAEDLTDAYLKLIDRLHPLTGEAGLAAAVYTQTTDVEIEVNGLLTYDREVIKMDPELIAETNRRLYTPPQPRVSTGSNLRPPATPLVACDPYFSIWSFSDQLTDEATRHWTGRNHPLTALLRLDGKTYRVMGNDPRRLPALPQKNLTVLPTRTIYEFEGEGVRLTLTFTTAALPEDIDLLSRPVTYVTWELNSTDGRERQAQLYFEASGEIAVNEPRQTAQWGSERIGDLRALRIGSRDQAVLGRKGDNVRIDWGYLYVAAPSKDVRAIAFANRPALQRSFIQNGLRSVEGASLPENPTAEQLGGALAMDLGKVGAAGVTRWLMVAYDDLYSIQYMKRNLRPYWRRNGWEAADLLQAAAADYETLTARCAAFDSELMADLEAVGGEKYARLAALAYRQCFAASKFVADANGQPLSFSKENFSNGCIGTSDVFYPMSPQFLLFGPSVAKSFLVPFMKYAASERWKFPFAPHDLGTYPHANGQVYGGGERTEENQMPVEESGNLLILMAAVAQMDGHADFAGGYWTTLTKWARYLREKGFDPENQLCTDDFAGHLAHNVNLSAKAICGLGAYAKLCAMRGDLEQAGEYRKVAAEFAQRWMKEADDGDHYRLAFDRPGTWSQKYNLVWDRILGLGLFPDSVKKKELDFYRRIQNRYGLPLDNRADYTKLDWIVWTATLTQSRADFDALIEPLYKWANETSSRVPMTDWFDTKTGRQVGFQARPVVGGVYLPLLYKPEVWRKWARRDATRASNWAPMPTPPKIVTVVPTARDGEPVWRYTTQTPARDWFRPDFDDSGWKSGAAGFGTRGTPGAIVRTEWNTPRIWIRRAFELPEGAKADGLQLFIHHDEDAEVYLNGERIADLSGYTTEYETLPLNARALKALKEGRNVLAIGCRQTGGGQYIDAGLVTVEEQ
jgi:hypothetical protein